MTSDPVNLDHNATTPIAPGVAHAMWPYFADHHGNPSSASPAGRLARSAIESARESVAALVGARPDEIVFTSGGTEANNLAIRGTLAARTDDGPARVVTSVVEHPATQEPLRHLASRGVTVGHLTVDAKARIDLAAMPVGAPALGTMILAQNEVGTIQPVRPFADAVHASGGLVHTDAAQAIGKIPVDVDELGVDLLSIAGHKLYAPKGIGVLYVRRNTPLQPLLRGAGQERGLRPGTENVASIVGLGRAAELATDALSTEEPQRQETLRERLWARLDHPGFVRLSPARGCLPNTLMVSTPHHLGRDVLARCPEVEASTGSACHAGVDAPAATLVAMGFPQGTALGAIRLSLGRSTSAADIDRAADALVTATNA